MIYYSHLKDLSDACSSSESNPADVLTLCGKDSSKVQDQIKKLCGDNVEAALYAYNTTCQEHGKLICMLIEFKKLVCLKCHMLISFDM